MNYFIDCGTNLFDGLKQFNRIYAFDNSWKIDCFEANPLIHQEGLKNVPNFSTNLSYYNKAIWINDGTIDVNINEDVPLDNGTNILAVPPERDTTYNRKFNWKTKMTVPCVDLSRLLSESTAEKNIVKIDIEGAEFEVLKRLIETDTLKKIDHLYVEFHERFFISEVEKYKQIKSSLISEIRNTVKVFREWE